MSYPAQRVRRRESGWRGHPFRQGAWVLGSLILIASGLWFVRGQHLATVFFHPGSEFRLEVRQFRREDATAGFCRVWPVAAGSLSVFGCAGRGAHPTGAAGGERSRFHCRRSLRGVRLSPCQSHYGQAGEAGLCFLPDGQQGVLDRETNEPSSGRATDYGWQNHGAGSLWEPDFRDPTYCDFTSRAVGGDARSIDFGTSRAAGPV